MKLKLTQAQAIARVKAVVGFWHPDFRMLTEYANSIFRVHWIRVNYLRRHLFQDYSWTKAKATKVARVLLAGFKKRHAVR